MRQQPLTPVGDWEVPAALDMVASHAGEFHAVQAVFRKKGHMKNTGKRIFFAAIVFALANAALLVAAGNLSSTR